MPYLLRPCLVFILLIIPLTLRAEVILTLDKTQKRHHEKIRQQLIKSKKFNSAVHFLNSVFKLPRTLYIHIGDYDLIWYQNDHIEIPYDDLHYSRKHYQSARFAHKRTKADDFVENMLIHIIFHEFAHAVIEQLTIPVLGKEEDAADSLADVLLLHFFNNGADIVNSAADAFFIEELGRRRFSNEELAAEHSLGKQRYYQRLCHIYGSAPEKYQALKRRAGFSNERAERCIMQYHQALDSWMRVLQPAMKPSLR